MIDFNTSIRRLNRIYNASTLVVTLNIYRTTVMGVVRKQAQAIWHVGHPLLRQQHAPGIGKSVHLYIWQDCILVAFSCNEGNGMQDCLACQETIVSLCPWSLPTYLDDDSNACDSLLPLPVGAHEMRLLHHRKSVQCQGLEVSGA
jgi:hypothetical protein